MNRLLASLLLLISTSATSVWAQAIPDAKALIKAQIQQAVHITPAELNQELQSNKPLVLIDVRQTSERSNLGGISVQDLSIPRGYIEIKAYGKVNDLDANVVVFCGKGIRSAFAANTLTQMGYRNVRNLEGGVIAWIRAGYPTVQP